MTKDKQKRFADLATTKFVADILMVGELERFISKAQIALQENGLYKQQVKRQMNELIKCNRMLFGNVQDAEAQWYTPIYTKCFPYYAKKFVGDGMSVSRQMQAAFISETKDRSQMLYLNYKQLMDKHGIAQSEVRALLYTISALSRIARRISERIYEQMEIVLYNRVVNKHPQRVNDKIEHCVKEILKTIGAGDFSIEKEEFKPIREYIEGITKSLISDDAAKLVCKVIEQFTYGYVDYCIAQMVIEAHGKGLSEDVRLEINDMLGKDGYADWDAFLMSIDVDDDDDAIDVIERLPKGNNLLIHVAQTLLQRLPYVEELKDSAVGA
jgi:hypothetical protein